MGCKIRLLFAREATGCLAQRGAAPLGIPRKGSTNERRPHFFRVTNLQKQQLLIHAREENLTLTDYILRHTLADEKALDDEDKNLVKELNRIGINLNQIARALNRGQNFAAEAKEVRQQIKKLDAFCDEILAARKAYFRELRQYHKEFLKLCQNENKSRELLKQLDASIQLKKLELKKLKRCKGGVIHGHP